MLQSSAIFRFIYAVQVSMETNPLHVVSYNCERFLSSIQGSVLFLRMPFMYFSFSAARDHTANA